MKKPRMTDEQLQERKVQEAAARKRAALDIAQYTTMWTKKHDPEFYSELIGKNVMEMIPQINQRYKLSFPEKTVTPAIFLYHLANGIEAYKNARVASKRVQEHRNRLAKENARRNERIKKAEQKKAPAKESTRKPSAAAKKKAASKRKVH